MICACSSSALVAGLDPEELVRQLAFRQIGYHFAAINASTDKMVRVFKEAYGGGDGSAEGFRVLRLYDITANFWAEGSGGAANNMLVDRRSRNVVSSFVPAVMSSVRHSSGRAFPFRSVPAHIIAPAVATRNAHKQEFKSEPVLPKGS